MTLQDWFGAKTPGSLCAEISAFPDRKIHLLTAAFLRRVRELLPSHHTRIAVEATEKFADGRMTPYQLARLRTSDTLETGEPLWLCGTMGWYARMPKWERDLRGISDEEIVLGHEKRVASGGQILPLARDGVDWPHWVAAKAAFLARELAGGAAEPEERATTHRLEVLAQLGLFRDLAGEEGWPVNPQWRQWRTDTVRLIARGIYAERAFDQLPILADALQDAGCEDADILAHCRRPGGHTRGCWVLDLAMGIS